MKIDEFAISLGHSLHTTIPTLQRGEEINQEWSTVLHAHAELILQDHLLQLAHAHGIRLGLIDMPYSAVTGSGRGKGRNSVHCEFIGGGKEKIYCFTDVIDGTWNAISGLLFSCSTMIAFTNISQKDPNELTLRDFQSGVVIPYCGRGIYIGEIGQATTLIAWDGEISPLRLSQEHDPTRARFILDLFTEEEQSSLEESIKVIGPPLAEWADFGRFYGAGVEVTCMLGVKNQTPSFAAHVSAHQKMDNIVPTYPLVVGAGGIVTDWWGESILDKKLTDRVHVIMAANATFHQNLVTHFSKRSR